MSWWQSVCVATAQVFFASLTEAKPEVKAKAKKVALQIYQNIKIAFANDPDFR
jgi:hypothetical protein